MTPTEFDFTVQMPGDERLVSAIRQLTTHAAGYAQLSADTGEQLASQVERATETAMSTSHRPDATIEFRFSANPEALEVMFTCALTALPPPAAASGAGATVEWTSDGPRHVCRIRQPLAGA
jgi:hypothetical protein